MAETTWAIVVSIASPIIAAGAALAATWMTNARHDRRERLTQSLDRRRVDRELVADVLLPAIEWVSLQEVLIPAYWKMTVDDMTEFVDTDSAIRLGELSQQQRAALLRAELFLADDPLRSRVRELSEQLESWADDVMGPLIQRKDDIEVVVEGLRHLGAYNERLRRLQKEAVDRLREPSDLTG